MTAMTYVWVCLAATLGVDYGWQPREGGGTEYIIQIEPEALSGPLEDREFGSAVPGFIQDVRSFRIRVGRGPVPRIGAHDPDDAGPVETSAAKPPLRSALARGASDAQSGPSLAGPANKGPTIRGQSPTAADQDDPYSAQPGRFSDSDQPEDFGSKFTTEKQSPFAKNRDSGVKPVQYREDEPTTAPRSGTTGRSTTSKSRTSTAKPPSSTRTNLDDEPDARTTTTKPKAGRSGASTSRTSADKEDREAAAERPWFGLTMAILALFASLGGNWYLGWMNWDLRNKYQRALNDRKWRRDDYEPSARVA